MIADLLVGLRWVIGLLFVTAGVAKLQVAGSFERSIASYGLVPALLHRPFARALPILEVCLGAVCLLGVLPVLAGWTAFVLLLSFAGAVGWNVARGRRFECGCGTMRDTTISWGLVLRDISLAAAAALVATGPSGSLAVWPGSVAASHHTQSVSDLLPIPMTVLLAFAASRLVTVGGSGRVWPPHRRMQAPQGMGSGSTPAVALTVVEVNGSSNGAVKVG